MKIIRTNINDFVELSKFNSQIYPEKSIDSSKYLKFWLSKYDAKIDDNLVIKDGNGKIQGQILTSPMSYYYNQERKDTVWLFDLIVNEELRHEAWGVDLILECMDAHPGSCSTGSGPTALPLHLKLGNKMLGEIRKYVGIINPLYLLMSYRRKRINIESFPNEVQIKDCKYRKVSKEDLPSYDKPFNDNLFEIARDRNFLKWRFFNDLHQYAFYLAENSQSYFVVRNILLKGFRVLELVDFRCKVEETKFKRILNAVHKVAREIRLPAVVCGSTLNVFDDVLEQLHYKSIGRPRPVIGFVKCKDRKKDIEKRNFCFVTLADSDGETNWI